MKNIFLNRSDLINTAGIEKLCGEIGMPPDITEAIRGAYNGFDFSPVKRYIPGLLNIKTGEESAGKIAAALNGTAQKYPGLLTLAAYICTAIAAREKYRKKGINDDIFINSMKVFSRFVNEHKISYGVYGFDREWWTYRFTSLSEFRIGELEYEICGEERALSVHIPSDAKLERMLIDASYNKAVEFFKEFFPGFKYKHIYCSSWLMSPELKKLLPNTSRILEFQKDYEITSFTPDEDSFMEWVYKREYTDYNELPENTSLEKNIKKHLLSGGKIGSAYGVMR